MIRGGNNAGIKKEKILWYFAHLFVSLHAKRAKLGCTSAIGASSIAFGLHELCAIENNRMIFNKRGCGCLLVVIAAIMAAVAALFLVVSYVADEDAGVKNEQAWEEYNANIPVIDSLEKAGVPDSIIAETYPRPHIRQGGFATLFGAVIAFGITLVALIPLIIGLILMRASGSRDH